MPRLRLRTVLPVAMSVAVLGALVGMVGVIHEPTSATSGQAAPSLAGRDLDSRARNLSDLRGEIVLVNFWASWCPPCEAEIPVLVRAERRYGHHGLAVLGVNTKDTLGNARSAAREWQADRYPNVHDEDGRIAVDWGVVGLPETFVIGRDGTIVERHRGPVTTEWLNRIVFPLVER